MSLVQVMAGQLLLWPRGRVPHHPAGWWLHPCHRCLHLPGLLSLCLIQTPPPRAPKSIHEGIRGPPG